MSVCRELDPMVEHVTQFALKGKRKHIAKVNMPNIAYPNQHIDTEIPYGSRDRVIVPDNTKITFNLEIESTDKARGVANNVGSALVKKKVLMLGSKDTDTINNSNTYGTYKDLHLSEKECEEKLLKAGSWLKSTCEYKKDTWQGTGSDNPRNCHYKDVS